MASKESMDLFGEALLAYTNGDRNIFYLKDEAGKKHTYDLGERFRPFSKLNKSEKKLISLAHGNILYVGCGTGNIVPALEKNGNVFGIDISPKVIEVANKMGYKNCLVADIFSFSPNRKFETIILFGNDLGIGGNIKKTEKLLNILKRILKDHGQILAIIRNYNKGDYKKMDLQPIWKNKSAPIFGWILFNANFLTKLCAKNKLKLKVISGSWKYKVLRITK